MGDPASEVAAIMKTGLNAVPDPTLHNNEALELETALWRKIVGQEPAVEEVAEIYQMFLAGLNQAGTTAGQSSVPGIDRPRQEVCGRTSWQSHLTKAKPASRSTAPSSKHSASHNSGHMRTPSAAGSRTSLKAQSRDLIHLKIYVVRFLLAAYGATLLLTALIVLLQGFKYHGFALEPSFLRWLGTATIGQMAVLLLLALKAVLCTEDRRFPN